MRKILGPVLAALLTWSAMTAQTPSSVAGERTTGSGAGARAQPAPTPGTHPPVQGPPGWQPGDFQRARLWVPGSWVVQPSGYPTRCGKGGGELLLGTGPLLSPSKGCGTTLVRVEMATEPPSRAVSRWIDGYQARTTARPGSDVGRWWVPALGVSFNFPSEAPVAVLGTLGPSPQGVVTEAGPATPVPEGWHAVQFAGAHLDTPGSWPTASADLTTPCGEPFWRKAAVYVGPNQGSLTVSCPLAFGPPPAKAGIWLQAGSSDGWPTVALRLPSGVGALEARDDNGPLLRLWFHGLFIQLGIGSNPFVERAILGSLRYDPGAPDTAVRYACPTRARHAMPHPVRLARHMHVLPFDGDGFYLGPPRSGQQARTSAAAAWRRSGLPAVGVTYRIYLARLTDDQAGGQHGTLVWAIYGVPHLTGLGPCTSYSLWLVDAGTGKVIEGASGY